MAFNINYGKAPLLCGVEADVLPQLPGTLTVINGVTCIQKPNGKVASLNPNSVWEERDPSQMVSPDANFWENCTPDADLNVLVFRYKQQGLPVVYKVAYRVV